MIGRQTEQCGPQGTTTLTRFTFVSPDGTAYDLGMPRRTASHWPKGNRVGRHFHSTNELGTKADIDIDFAFLLHLPADNSNVQAGNNYQRFKGRYHVELQTMERILKG